MTTRHVGWKCFTPCAVVMLVSCSLALAWTSAGRKSVTVDEFITLPQGLLFWSSGHAAAKGVAQLPAALAALPVHLGGVRLEPSSLADPDDVWQVGFDFRDARSDEYREIFDRARRVPIAMLGALLLLTAAYARSLYGAGGGLLALGLAAFSPNLLAHGRLVTADVAFALALVGTVWSCDGFLRLPSVRRAALLGAVLGLANLCKHSGVLLTLFLPALLAGLALWGRARPASCSSDLRISTRHWLGLALALLVSFAVIQVGYAGFDFPAVGSLALDSTALRVLADRLPGWLPAPWPRAFISGLDWQLAETGYTSYLLGQTRVGGFPHYYLVALLVKLPALTLGVWILAFWGRPAPSIREVLPLLGAGFYALIFSVAGHKNIGIRYLLFVIPLLAVFAGRLATPNRVAGSWGRRRLGAAIAAAALNAGLAFSVWPDYLPYFNRFAGGTLKGHEYLLDSNLDWGQDLPALRDYMAREGIASIDLAYYGRSDPALYGVRYRLLGAGAAAPARYLAISANFLWGLPYYVNGSQRWLKNPQAFAPLRARTPSAVLGGSIYVFDRESWERDTRELGTPDP